MKKLVLILALLLSSVFANFEEISSEEFEQKIKGKNVILDFFAHWCPACTQTEEHLDFYNQTKNNDVVIYKMNVELNPEFSLKQGAKALPTLLYIKDGEVVYKQSGFQNYEQIEENVKEYIEN